MGLGGRGQLSLHNLPIASGSCTVSLPHVAAPGGEVCQPQEEELRFPWEKGGLDTPDQMARGGRPAPGGCRARCSCPLGAERTASLQQLAPGASWRAAGAVGHWAGLGGPTLQVPMLALPGRAGEGRGLPASPRLAPGSAGSDGEPRGPTRRRVPGNSRSARGVEDPLPASAGVGESWKERDGGATSGRLEEATRGHRRPGLPEEEEGGACSRW